jgi:hypothetical protein
MVLQIDLDLLHMQLWCQVCAADNLLGYRCNLGGSVRCEEAEDKLRQKMVPSQGRPCSGAYQLFGRAKSPPLHTSAGTDRRGGGGRVPARSLVATQGVFDNRIPLFDTKVTGNHRTLGLEEMEYRPLFTGECFVVPLSFTND